MLALAHEFPDLQESTMYGSPALKLGKRLVACVASHRSAEPGSVVVRTDFAQRAALLGPRDLAADFRDVDKGLAKLHGQKPHGEFQGFVLQSIATLRSRVNRAANSIIGNCPKCSRLSLLAAADRARPATPPRLAAARL